MSSGAEPRTPRTPFSIADILGPRMVPQLPESGLGRPSPLCALEELTSQTLRGLDGRALQAPEGHAPRVLSPGPAPRRRRRARTAFTAQQVRELERRFGLQKYLAPAERDWLAARLGLDNAQVVTWFQNRRAKLKRDAEEMRADLASWRAIAVPRRLSLPDGAPGAGPALSTDGAEAAPEAPPFLFENDAHAPTQAPRPSINEHLPVVCRKVDLGTGLSARNAAIPGGLDGSELHC
ncbi:transcription factor LBX2 [Rhynchocyon petersi]